MPFQDALSAGIRPAQRGEGLVASLFASAGWKVHRPAEEEHRQPDLMVRRNAIVYAVEIKVASEGRSDRLIPLWSQACIQAARVARKGEAPLAIVMAPRIAPKVAQQILDFAAENAPEIAVGVIDFAGLRRFNGPGLENLSAAEPPHPLRHWAAARSSSDPFSDLQQWMLKVLLAPELDPRYLSAPRGRYRNAAQLGKAAEVSAMSAHRFVDQLRREHYLDDAAPYLRLVRREDLFRQWQASSMRRIREMPMRLLLGGGKKNELHRVLRESQACLALFAAAESLRAGFVHGVPPYAYVEHLNPEHVAGWKNLGPVKPGEPPSIILRQAPVPRAIFRGAVMINDLRVCDIIQVWLDVSSHPSRGQEQADLIRRRVLDDLIRSRHAD